MRVSRPGSAVPRISLRDPGRRQCSGTRGPVVPERDRALLDGEMWLLKLVTAVVPPLLRLLAFSSHVPVLLSRADIPFCPCEVRPCPFLWDSFTPDSPQAAVAPLLRLRLRAAFEECGGLVQPHTARFPRRRLLSRCPLKSGQMFGTRTQWLLEE